MTNDQLAAFIKGHNIQIVDLKFLRVRGSENAVVPRALMNS
jgi:hypothetical protein